MSRQNRDMAMENLLPGKIRKRGCSSPPSSTSSMIQNYRFKRAILVGRKKGGSSTPTPAWKLMMRSPSSASALRAMESPKYSASQSGSKSKVQQQQQQQQPVSARKLAATLWEMNEIPSPGIKEAIKERSVKEGKGRRERVPRSVHSGSLPPHLSDPSYSPASERMDRSGTGSRHKGASSISHRLRMTNHNAGVYDSVSNASLMEIETRSRAQTPTGSTTGAKTRLKDVSNALTTSKELLKIINRIWAGQEDRPSSSMSLISALHAELERARLQVNQLIHDQRSEHNDINYLMKCFAEEKAAWKDKEQKVVEAAIESVAGELDVERRLRRRVESLNKKLGKELAETKESLTKALKEFESEKKARVVFEKICNELARSINEDNPESEDLNKEPVNVFQEVEKEREMMRVADVLREERVQMKLTDAKYHLEEKNEVIDKLRSQLEAFLGTKRAKGKLDRSLDEPSSEEITAYLDRARFEENGEVEDGVECEEDSAESDLHSIELNMDNNNIKYQKWARALGPAHNSGTFPFHVEETRERKSTSSIRPPRKNTSLQRSISDGVDWGMQNQRLQNSGEELDWRKLIDMEKLSQERGPDDEMHGYKLGKGIREQLLSSASRVHVSPARRSRDHNFTAQDKPPMVPSSLLKPKAASSRGEGQNARKSKW